MLLSAAYQQLVGHHEAQAQRAKEPFNELLAREGDVGEHKLVAVDNLEADI
jgi:hypothetical protein